MNESTAATRAIACTATGVHSSLPLWEWLPGMLSVETTAEHRLRRRRILQVTLADHWGDRVPFVQLEMDGWIRLSTFTVFGALPDFSDALTLHGLHALVIRAWTGHEVRLTTGVVDAGIKRNIIAIVARNNQVRLYTAGNNDLALLLVGALEAAPRMSR